MTVISEQVSSIAGADNNTIFGFQSILDREAFDGTGMITTALITMQASSGVLTTPDLDPGATIVYVGSRRYKIDIPDSDTPIRLMPLIADGLPITPVQEARALIARGSLTSIEDVTESWWAANPHNPGTLYVLIPDPD
ncbi:hypothetical protein ACWEKR_06200 [Nocardia sp. NPDC004573]